MGVSLSSDEEKVLQAHTLLWTACTVRSVQEGLRALGLESAPKKTFSQEAIKSAREKLLAKKFLMNVPGRLGYARVAEDKRDRCYRDLLEQFLPGELKQALMQVIERNSRSSYSWGAPGQEDAIPLLRLLVYTGHSAQQIETLWQQLRISAAWKPLVRLAVIDGLDVKLLPKIQDALRAEILAVALADLNHYWQANLVPIFQWVEAAVADSALTAELRYQCADILLHREERERLRELLRGEDDPDARALLACALVQEGQWAQAQELFESALKELRQITGTRKNLLPDSILWMYPLCLLAQQTPEKLLLARKFCLLESGTRTAEPSTPWGAWVHAIDVRLGDATFHTQALCYSPGSKLASLWFALLRAWLGKAAPPIESAWLQDRRKESLQEIHEHLRACGFTWMDKQLTIAEQVYDGKDAPEECFVGGGTQNWRTVLASLQALGAPTIAAPTAAEKATRLLWEIALGEEGELLEIRPLEQKHGARGWNTPKPLPLAKLVQNHRLEPQDAKVIPAIQSRHMHSREYHLDRAKAMAALIGHPLVILRDAPDVPVDVVAGTPEIEVSREGKRYVLQLRPQPRAVGGANERHFAEGSPEKRELEALRSLIVVRDGPQRIRVFSFTPAQRHAAQILAGNPSVPEEAQADLEQTLASLASHFQVQTDHRIASRELDADPRLRAELSPMGDGLLFRLVVAPFGVEGPKFLPGTGHARVMATLQGETLGANRDLAVEKQHQETLLDAFPFLSECSALDADGEWMVDDPESALTLVETLPTLPAVAGVDWPRGKPVRVRTLETKQVQVEIGTGRDWFTVQGQVPMEEGLVLSLEALLAAAAGTSRFVPMGQGLYLALTRDLRERLRDLAAIAEKRSGGMRVPALAASWLQETLKGTVTQADKAFLQKVERLRAAQDVEMQVPDALQAELRPYQEEGILWILRLAHAGFGACLADDMGLGKTLQAIAAALSRAEDGPTLVVAPTSVCGNWFAEIQRFAPTLQPSLYRESERSSLLENAGARDVVIVSYALLQQAHAAFAARNWHTLIVDEAQVIKNAIAKRTQAVFQIPADFRLALSGTPVENRLAELWSIMRFCNPGLLGSLSQFRERFAGPIERNRDREAQRRLRRLLAPFILRRTKSQVLDDLPPRTELVWTVPLEKVEAAHYEALRRQAVTAAEAALEQSGLQARFQILAQLTKLRRAACDPRLVTPDLDLVGAKVQTFTELVSELTANGHKALVFSQFVDFLTLLREPLDAAKIAYQYLDGSTPSADREQRVRDFQAGKGELFLISLKAGGFGLNLTAADYVIIADPWWNPAAEDQAMGRAHRIGQSRPVTVYRLVAQGTIEEQILALHHDKRALAESVLVESEEGSKSLPSQEDLLALMRG